MTRARDERGVVLLLVLVVIVLTVGTVYAFARTSLLSVAARQGRDDRARAELLARSGIDIAIRALQDDLLRPHESVVDGLDTPLAAWHALGQIAIEVPGEGELRIRVRDAGHRINLNALVGEDGEPLEESRVFLIAALERIIEELPQRREEKPWVAQDVADALLDWIDLNEVSRLGDNESDSYARQGAKVAPPNRPLFALEELADLPGLDGALLEVLDAYFTTQPPYPEPGRGGINPNTAPPHMLGLIYRGTTGDKRLLGADDVFAILRARREGRIFCPGSTEEPCVSFQSEIGRVGETVFPPLRYQGSLFVIRTEARFEESRACVETTIDRARGETRTLSFWLGC